LLGGFEQRVDGVASVVGVGVDGVRVGVGELVADAWVGAESGEFVGLGGADVAVEECVAGTGDGVEECGDFDGAGGLAV
jgi:hypothetical protein